MYADLASTFVVQRDYFRQTFRLKQRKTKHVCKKYMMVYCQDTKQLKRETNTFQKENKQQQSDKMIQHSAFVIIWANIVANVVASLAFSPSHMYYQNDNILDYH